MKLFTLMGNCQALYSVIISRFLIGLLGHSTTGYVNKYYSNHHGFNLFSDWYAAPSIGEILVCDKENDKIPLCLIGGAIISWHVEY